MCEQKFMLKRKCEKCGNYFRPIQEMKKYLCSGCSEKVEQEKHDRKNRLAIQEHERFIGGISVLKNRQQPKKAEELSFIDCENAAAFCANEEQFKKYFPAEHSKSVCEGWDVVLISKFKAAKGSRSFKYCFEFCQNLTSIVEVMNKDHRSYTAIYTNDWTDWCYSHMGAPGVKSGWSLSSFIECCVRNNDGIGIIYLLKCWRGEEEFHKLGITSRSVAKRYLSAHSMPYEYEIVWQYEGDPRNIFYTEQSMKSSNRRHKYEPRIRFGGHTECFKNAPKYVPVDISTKK